MSEVEHVEAPRRATVEDDAAGVERKRPARGDWRTSLALSWWCSSLPAQAKTYWLMYGLYTFSLVLLLSAPGQVGFEAEDRGVEILVGTGLLVVGLTVVHALAAREAKRDPQPELAPG